MFFSCKSQVNSSNIRGCFFTDDKKNDDENKGIINNARRIILVGKIFRNKFVEKSKEENKSFIIW